MSACIHKYSEHISSDVCMINRLTDGLELGTENNLLSHAVVRRSIKNNPHIAR